MENKNQTNALKGGDENPVNRTSKLNDKQRRALKYAMSLCSFQEAGMGPDENLQTVRNIVSEIQGLCLSETGIKLESYPVDFIKSLLDEKNVLEYLPMTIQRIAKIGQWELNLEEDN